MQAGRALSNGKPNPRDSLRTILAGKGYRESAPASLVGANGDESRDPLLGSFDSARSPANTVEYSAADGNREIDVTSLKNPHHHIVWMSFVEFTVTFLYAFVSVLVVSLSLPFLYQALAQTAVIVFTLAISITHSGGHLSPFITGLFVLLGRFHWWHGLIYILLVHPLGFSAGSGAAVAISPAPLLASVPFHLPSYWRVGIYEGIGTAVFAIALSWSVLSPTVLRTYPQVLPNHDRVGIIALPIPVLTGFAYLCTALPGTFISGSVYNFYRYFFPALYAGALTWQGVLAYLLGPLVGILLIWLGTLVFAYAVVARHRDAASTNTFEGSDAAKLQ